VVQPKDGKSRVHFALALSVLFYFLPVLIAGVAF
jgi:hypothetical protein